MNGKMKSPIVSDTEPIEEMLEELIHELYRRYVPIEDMEMN